MAIPDLESPWYQSADFKENDSNQQLVSSANNPKKLKQSKLDSHLTSESLH
jgi:hypothetical protein